jgi:protein involved in polysaccharide export with SLBB domain
VKKYQTIYRSLLIFCVAFPAVLPANAQDAKPAEAPTIAVATNDLVHFGDLIDVDIVGGFEFDWRGKLTPEGFLDGLESFSEPVYGLCKSEAQIAAEVARIYSRILKEPKVVVRIIDRSNRAVATLNGAVKAPARFRLSRKATLRELIVMTGGLLDSSSGEVAIFRPKNASCMASPEPSATSDNTSQTFLIKISDLLKGGPGSDPWIVGGDIVTILTADPIYVMGAVGNPRPIFSREKLSLSRVIAMAGGLAKNADGGKVTIFRRDNAATKVVEADLMKIEKGESVDELLKPFDIIDVAARGRQKQKFPPVIVRDDPRDKRPELPLRIVE